MATNDSPLTDDYVAGLLAKDAKDNSIKYSSVGLDAFKETRAPASKPKPNTRFLRNIIKDTDSHNAALLAKEAAESRARLHDLAGSGHRVERASRIGGGDIRKRQLGDIAAILGGGTGKRKRATDSKKENTRPRRVNTSSDDEGSQRKDAARRYREHRADDDRDDYQRSKTRRSRLEEEHEAEDSRGHGKHHKRRQRSTSEDSEDGRKRRRRHRSSSRDHRSHRDSHRRRKSRSRSPRELPVKESRHHRSSNRQRSSTPELVGDKSHRSHRHPRSPTGADRDGVTASRSHRKEESPKRERPEPSSDSDPLDDIIGPRPAPATTVRSRGRGIASRGSGIEARFSESYDPTTDVQLNPDEENDWDQALEALRDRQKWKQAGASRLRAAGFTDEEITKWEKGGEKREEDVKWAKRGEGREWDRGKVVDFEGSVTVDPGWGRLKGT